MRWEKSWFLPLWTLKVKEKRNGKEKKLRDELEENKGLLKRLKQEEKKGEHLQERGELTVCLPETEMCQEFWQKLLYKLALLRGSLHLPAVTLLTQLHQLTFPTVIPHPLPSQISWIWKKKQLRDGNQWEFAVAFPNGESEGKGTAGQTRKTMQRED